MEEGEEEGKSEINKNMLQAKSMHSTGKKAKKQNKKNKQQ